MSGHPPVEELTSHAQLFRQSVSNLELSVRASNCLRGAGIETIGQLLKCSNAELLRVPALGVKTLREILLALEQLCVQSGGTLNSGLTSESQTIAECRSGSTRANAEFDGKVVLSADETEQQILAFLKTFAVRERAILRGRILRSAFTLEELGQQFNVTRERVRQIETKLRKRLRSYLASFGTDSVRCYVGDLKQALGSAVPIERVSEYCLGRISATVASDDDRDFIASFVLWIAGPYIQTAGWLTLGQELSHKTKVALDGALDSRGWLSSKSVSDTLLEAGIRAEYHAAWLVGLGFVPVDAGWLPSLKSIPDRAEQAIRYRGLPITAEELVGLVVCESERSLRQRLLDDGRFKRISRKGHFALREWSQFDEYGGIAEEISEEIGRQGGSATSHHLIEVLTKKYGVSPSSVSQYILAPMFIKDRDGRVRLRGPDEALKVSADPRLCSSLYFVDGCWTLRIEITSDTMRGSGRPSQMAVAVLMGCQPGERRVFRSPADEIVISWPQSSAVGPNLGSVKPDVEALGGEVGDFVFLTFGSSDIGVRLLRASELITASPAVKIALLVGLQVSTESETDRWQEVASAIGLTGGARAIEPDEIHAQLMRRNEVALAGLVRLEFPQSSDNILDRLENILGL